MIYALFQGFNLQLELTFSINVFKMQAVMLEFQLHVKK